MSNNDNNLYLELKQLKEKNNELNKRFDLFFDFYQKSIIQQQIREEKNLEILNLALDKIKILEIPQKLKYKISIGGGNDYSKVRKYIEDIGTSQFKFEIDIKKSWTPTFSIIRNGDLSKQQSIEIIYKLIGNQKLSHFKYLTIHHTYKIGESICSIEIDKTTFKNYSEGYGHCINVTLSTFPQSLYENEKK